VREDTLDWKSGPDDGKGWGVMGVWYRRGEALFEKADHGRPRGWRGVKGWAGGGWAEM
jgi:hypothetical protein